MDDLPEPPARIAVSVEPRLLADSLVSLLADMGLEVQDAGDTTPVAVALVTPGAPTVPADLVLELANGPGGTAVATVHDRHGTPELRLEGLAAIMAFLGGWTTHGVERTGGHR